ncbi:hypothetical protein [Amycolatopsis sp. A1MSW2902]|uniref:hypothetical protein n=1 Tax=Amycolatopsis sp. A1MSW2902 TaxID=687413 RepID=UPI00307E8EB9
MTAKNPRDGQTDVPGTAGTSVRGIERTPGRGQGRIAVPAKICERRPLRRTQS